MRLVPASTPIFDDQVERKAWPVRWISVPAPAEKSYVVAYRLYFDLEKAAKITLHVSADQRYRLFVDGKREGEGPERGDLLNWFYQTYEMHLAAGSHCLVVLVWTLAAEPGIIPGAQISLDHGLMVAADSPFTPDLSTGRAGWEYQVVGGVAFRSSGLRGAGELSGATVRIDGTQFPWGVERGVGGQWNPAIARFAARSRLGNDNWGVLDTPLMKPGTLPSDADRVHTVKRVRYVGEFRREETYQRVDSAGSGFPDAETVETIWADGAPVEIPPHANRWFLIDLEDYYCGFPELRVSRGKGSEIDVLWAESLYEAIEPPSCKGHRDIIEEKYFFGRGDTFVPTGGHELLEFTTFWWSCGRYVALCFRTGDEALLVHALRVRESRYPLEAVARLELDCPDFERSRGMMWRAIQMCAHETYMDCPYYEQMNYSADTRIQALVTYVVSGDERLARRCIELFASSLLPSGMTSARYPSEHAQVIPQFSLFWIAMLHDYAVWRREPRFVRGFLPQVRFILDTFFEHVGEDGLLICPDGWDWLDWAWVGPASHRDFTAANQLQLIYVVRLAMELEREIGRAETAGYLERMLKRLWSAAVERFWSEERGLFAATEEHDVFGEHEQCFAVLSGMLDDERRRRIRKSLVESEDLDRATFYFRHYLFESYAELGIPSEIIRCMKSWGKMVDLGLRTTLEKEADVRSDCHAWSAHPLYHAAVSIAGIRPDGFGFKTVRIAPALDVVASACVSIPHADGMLTVSWQTVGKKLLLTVELPPELTGVLQWKGESVPLNEGQVNYEFTEHGGPEFR